MHIAIKVHKTVAVCSRSNRVVSGGHGTAAKTGSEPLLVCHDDA